MERESRRQRTLSIVLNQVAEIFQKVLLEEIQFRCSIIVIRMYYETNAARFLLCKVIYHILFHTRVQSKVDGWCGYGGNC